MTEIDEKFDLTDRDEFRELDFDDQATVLKATVTMPEVAMLLGIEADEGDKIPSPWNPDERTPSCHLYEDHFFDYSSGRGGDIFDFLVAINPDDYPNTGAAIWAVYDRAVKAGKEYGEVEQAKPRDRQDFSDQLPPTPFVDMLDLKVPEQFGCRIDHEGNVLVPHRDPDGVYGVKVRYANGGKGSWAGSMFMTRLYDPWGWDSGRFPSTTVVLCEGESDCWALNDVLFPTQADVLALPSGAGSWKDHWLDDLVGYYRVFVCMDNDKAGQAARDKLMLKIGYSRAERLDVPQLYGDAREAIAAGWKPTLD